VTITFPTITGPTVTFPPHFPTKAV
jgi:hypothetical protein